jgi:HSP20 family protein
MFGTLFSSNAFDDVRRLENELDQLLSRSPYSSGIRAVPRGTFPPINVGATSDQVDVYLFAAGIDPGTVSVSVQQNLLAVSGTRKVTGNPDAEYYRRERFDGDFHRVIALPDDADPDRVEAHYRDGVLHITVKRRQAAKPRQIQIQ